MIELVEGNTTRTRSEFENELNENKVQFVRISLNMRSLNLEGGGGEIYSWVVKTESAKSWPNFNWRGGGGLF